MSTAVSNWRAHVRGLRSAQVETMRQAPYKDLCLAPNPAGSETDVDAAERRLDLSLPPSYRSFLLQHDGWVRCFQGVSLLAAGKLERAKHAEFGWMLRATTMLSRSHTKVSDLVIFGLDASRSTVLCFDTSRRRSGEEYPVLAWINELGVNSHCFADLLDLMRQLLLSDLKEPTSAMERTASYMPTPSMPTSSTAAARATIHVRHAKAS